MPVLGAGKLKDLYSNMVKCRLLAERIYGQHSSSVQTNEFGSGLEAMFVGAGAHLLPHDCVALEHGGFIASLIKGTPLQTILSRSTKPGDGPTGAPALNMSTALTLAREMKGLGAVTLMFCPKSSGSLAFDPQAMGLAAAEKLPLIALTEISLNAKPQSQDAAPAAVDATYYPRITVDGCDVVAVFRVTQEAVRRARQGHGPALIECAIVRAAELAGDEALAHDPLAFMEQYLRRRELWSDEWVRSIVSAFSRELDEAAASTQAPAGFDGQFDNVYASDITRPQSHSQAPPPQAIPAQ